MFSEANAKGYFQLLYSVALKTLSLSQLELCYNMIVDLMDT